MPRCAAFFHNSVTRSLTSKCLTIDSSVMFLHAIKVCIQLCGGPSALEQRTLDYLDILNRKVFRWRIFMHDAGAPVCPPQALYRMQRNRRWQWLRGTGYTCLASLMVGICSAPTPPYCQSI